MCELFAFSGEHPVSLCCSRREFAAHNGGARKAEGWGVAHCIDGDVRRVKEPGVARDSACLNFIEQRPIRSALVPSHLRHATQGVSAVRNCQPFVRERGGAMREFAQGHRHAHADGDIRPPGLHVLYRSCDGEGPSFDAQGLRIGSSTDGGAQALVASVPLTADATSRPLATGELIVLRAGRS